MDKHIYLSDTDKKIGGVIGGIAEHFDLDSTLLRLLVVFVMLVTGILPGIFTYLVALIIIPARPGSSRAKPPKSVMEQKRKMDEEEQQPHATKPGEGAPSEGMITGEEK
jgi:phage shock protein C